MPNTDVFALDRSGFNGFLFAAIGTEAGGSSLTVLSALARLGDDPWAKAALWAGMSKPAASEALAACIATMPLTQADLLAAPSTAARLVLMLSPSATSAPPGSAPQPRRTLVFVLTVLAFAMVVFAGALLVSMPRATHQVQPASHGVE